MDIIKFTETRKRLDIRFADNNSKTRTGMVVFKTLNENLKKNQC